MSLFFFNRFLKHPCCVRHYTEKGLRRGSRCGLCPQEALNLQEKRRHEPDHQIQGQNPRLRGELERSSHPRLRSRRRSLAQECWPWTLERAISDPVPTIVSVNWLRDKNKGRTTASIRSSQGRRCWLKYLRVLCKGQGSRNVGCGRPQNQEISSASRQHFSLFLACYNSS